MRSTGRADRPTAPVLLHVRGLPDGGLLIARGADGMQLDAALDALRVLGYGMRSLPQRAGWLIDARGAGAAVRVVARCGPWAVVCGACAIGVTCPTLQRLLGAARPPEPPPRPSWDRPTWGWAWTAGSARARPAAPLTPPSMGVREAARTLGLALPVTDATQIEAAFRETAARVHPDHGGSDLAMRDAITARAALRAELRRRA